MIVGLIEWFAKKIGFEYIKNRYFGSDDRSDSEIEDELWESFAGREFILSQPVLPDDSVADELVEVEEEITGEIVGIDVFTHRKRTYTRIDIAFDDSLLTCLPNEEKRAENSLSFWYEKDEVSISFENQSRVGPLLSVIVPSIRKSQIDRTIRAVSETTSRTVYLDTLMMDLAYQALEAGFDQGAGLDELNEEVDDLSKEELREALRVLLGTVTGHEPEYQLETDRGD